MNKYGRRLRINFDVHSSEPLGTISMVQSSGSPPHSIKLKPQTKILHGHFTVEQLREIRREISRILLTVELKHKKERSKKIWEKLNT